MVDKTLPYMQISGPPAPYPEGTRYIQNGRYFRANGDEIVAVGISKPTTQLEPTVVASKPEQKQSIDALVKEAVKTGDWGKIHVATLAKYVKKEFNVTAKKKKDLIQVIESHEQTADTGSHSHTLG